MYNKFIIIDWDASPPCVVHTALDRGPVEATAGVYARNTGHRTEVLGCESLKMLAYQPGIGAAEGVTSCPAGPPPEDPPPPPIENELLGGRGVATVQQVGYVLSRVTIAEQRIDVLERKLKDS